MKPSLRSNRSLRAGCLALLAALTLCLAGVPAWAGGQVPFRAVFDTEYVSTGFPVLSVQVVGEGKATHLGATTIESTDQIVDLTTYPFTVTATYVFTSANGGELVVAFDLGAVPVFDSLWNPIGLIISGDWIVTGGTGRFAGATGSGTLEGEAWFTGEHSGADHLVLTGTVSSPGSLK